MGFHSRGKMHQRLKSGLENKITGGAKTNLNKFGCHMLLS